MKPAIFECASRLDVRVQVSRRDIVAADQNLAVLGDLDLDAANRRPDRSLARLERVIERDDRCRLGEAIALAENKSTT